MTATPLTDVAQRLLANVDAEHGDYGEAILNVPVARYRDEERFQQELEQVFRRSPLLVALSCDIPSAGDFTTLAIAERPILVVRGDDGTARTFLNVCRHRGAPVTQALFGHTRRFTCPYHFWVYDTKGALVGNTDRKAFEGLDVSSLVELPTAERCGAVFAVLTPGLEFDVDEWLGDMASSLAYLQLEKLHRHEVETILDSGNWKATADGYVDGYHLGYLHRDTIGTKSITNRNTYDLYGPHVRLGFANKPLPPMREVPVDEWQLNLAMSLVHYVFPNVSISGQPNTGLMVSRVHPGPTADKSTVSQYQYFREPLVTEEMMAEAERKRATYEAVTRDEDFATVMKITAALPSIADDHFRFGRNERGNQNLHRWIDALVDGTPPPT
jgi:phenylpropionate dioxygenase-like ring-hydroxylating dioxygenase large terminal subunit